MLTDAATCDNKMPFSASCWRPSLMRLLPRQLTLPVTVHTSHKYESATALHVHRDVTLFQVWWRLLWTVACRSKTAVRNWSLLASVLSIPR